MAINLATDAKFGKLAIVMNETLFDFAAPTEAQIEAQIAQIKGNIPFFAQFASAGSSAVQIETFAEIKAFEQLVAATLQFPQFAGLSSLQIARQSFINIDGVAPSDAAINSLLAAYNGNVAILIANIIVQEAAKPATDLAAGTFLAQAANGTAVFGVPLINPNHAPTNIVDATDGDQTLNVVERSAAGTLVGSLKSIDADLGDSGTFSLAAASNVFEINAVGEIRVKAGATAPDAGSVVLSVKVTDQGGASVTKNITVVLAPDPALHNFSLTALTAETVLGTAGPDTFSSNRLTLNPGDDIKGGAGDDTLRYASVLGGAQPATGFTSSSVENLDITGELAFGGAALDATGMAGLKRIVNSNSSGDVTVTGIGAIDGTLVDLELNKVTGGDTNLTYDAPVVAGTTDVQKVRLTDVNDLFGNSASGIRVNGIETFDITAVGPQPSNLTFLDSDSIDKVIVRGSAKFTVDNDIGTAGGPSLSSFDASANTGGVEVSLNLDDTAMVKGSTAADKIIIQTGGGTVAGSTLTVDMGAGDDLLTINGGTRLGTVDVKTGAGKDTLDVTAAGNLRTGHTYDGGTEEDTFKALDAQIDQIQSPVDPNNPVIKAFETLEVTDSADGIWDMDEISQDFNRLVLAQGLKGNLVVNDIKNNFTVDVNTQPLHTDGKDLTITHKVNTAADVVNVIIRTDDSDGTNEIQKLSVPQAETLNLTVDAINNNNTDVNLGQIDGVQLKTINLTGDADFTLTGPPASTLGNLTTFDATGFTGSTTDLASLVGSNAGITFDFRNASNSADSNVFGQAGNDTIRLGGGDDKAVFGQGGADFIDAGDGNDGTASVGAIVKDGAANGINGGDGDDIVLGGKGNDFVFGNDGKDNVQGEDGNDHVYGWAGDDTLGGGAGQDQVRGGAGKDFVDGGSGADDLWGDRDAADLDDVAGNNFVQHQVKVNVGGPEAGDTFTINVTGTGGFNSLVSYTALAGETADDVEAKLEDLLDNALGQSTGVGVAGTDIVGNEIVIRGPVDGSQFTVSLAHTNRAPVAEVRTITLVNDQPDLGDVVNIDVNGTVYSITAPGTSADGTVDNSAAEIATLLQAAYNAAPVPGVTLSVAGGVMTFTEADGPFVTLAHTVNFDNTVGAPGPAAAFHDITFNGFDAGEQVSVQYNATVYTANSLAAIGTSLVTDVTGDSNTDGFVLVDKDGNGTIDTIRFFDRDGAFDGTLSNATVLGGNGGSASIAAVVNNPFDNDQDIASVVTTPGAAGGTPNETITQTSLATGAAATVDDNTGRFADTFGIGSGLAPGQNINPLATDAANIAVLDDADLKANVDTVHDFDNAAVAFTLAEGDTLHFTGLGAGTISNYAETNGAANGLDALGLANALLGGTTRFVAVEVNNIDVYVFADSDGDGSADQGVLLIGVGGAAAGVENFSFSTIVA